MMSDKDEIKPKEVTFPPSVREAPKNKDPVRSLQEFVKRTGFLYKKNPNDNLADPFAALSIMPGRTADMKDLSAVRGQFPDWTPTNCDECGACYTACPDNALLGLVNTVEEVIATNIAIIEKNGQDAKLFKKHVKTLAEIFRSLSKVDARATTTALLFREAVDLTVEKTGLPEQEKKILETQGALFLDAMGGFKFLPTKSGGLFSITVDPWKCKGCMLCEEADVCGKGGITAVTETEEDTARMKKMWDYQRKLPSTNPGFCRISNLNEGAGCLESLLLDKDNVKTYGGGSGTCVGCGEQEPIRLLTATVSALMKPRVNVHIDHLKNLVSEMEAKIEGFVGAANMRSEDALQEIVNGMNPEDYEWYLRGTDTLGALKDLVWKYTEGVNGRGRSDMMVANATGCSSVAGATWPFTPFLFPWMNNLFQDSATVAANLFTGHMDKMADGFKAVRTAELIVAGETDKTKYDFTYFGWKDFTEEEFLLCPPIVAVGGDGAMYDIGFQNVSRVLASGIPVKIFVLDTGAYSNTGGQNCTSGFKGQIADLAPFGAFRDGKQEVRKELALLAMGHRTSYVYQGSTADSGHLISGLIEGLNYRGPSLFNIYCACPPEHIIADNAGVAHSKMARNSRAYPQFKFYPDEDKPWSECLSLEGNPDTDEDWPTYDLSYKNKYGKSLKMKCKFTFADFASKEGRFKDHFTREKADLWTPELVPLSDYLDVPKTEREGLVPYIFGTDEKENLIRILPKKIMVESCADRKSFWRLLKELAGISKKTENVSSFNEKDLREQIRKEELAKFMAKFAGLLAGEGVSLVDLPAAPKETSADNTVKAKESTGEKTVTIDTDDCTVCEKCFEVNKKVFGQREEDGKAVVLDPKGGTFAEIVKAAEQCTGGLIHPGTPQNPNEKNMEKLLKRAEKYQQ